jgi:hypothetical protein
MAVLLFSAAAMLTTLLYLRRLSQFDMAVYYAYKDTPSRETGGILGEGERFQ